MTMLADMDVPVSAFTGWFPGLLGFLFLVALLLTIWNSGKKAFGRKPTIGDEMTARDKTLRSEIYHATGSAKKEITARIEGIERRQTELEELYKEMQLDRERKWNELRKEYHQLELALAKLTGRVESLLKKMETL